MSLIQWTYTDGRIIRESSLFSDVISTAPKHCELLIGHLFMYGNLFVNLLVVEVKFQLLFD